MRYKNYDYYIKTILINKEVKDESIYTNYLKNFIMKEMDIINERKKTGRIYKEGSCNRELKINIINNTDQELFINNSEKESIIEKLQLSALDIMVYKLQKKDKEISLYLKSIIEILLFKHLKEFHISKKGFNKKNIKITEIENEELFSIISVYNDLKYETNIHISQEKIYPLNFDIKILKTKNNILDGDIYPLKQDTLILSESTITVIQPDPMSQKDVTVNNIHNNEKEQI